MSKNKKKSNITISRDKFRLSIRRSNLHIYAQIIDDKSGVTIESFSSLKLKGGTKKDQAAEVGKELAKNALKKDIKHLYYKEKT